MRTLYLCERKIRVEGYHRAAAENNGRRTGFSRPGDDGGDAIS
jgi:hypothetical protein